jgi:small-conductance mechanosensitive channel
MQNLKEALEAIRKGTARPAGRLLGLAVPPTALLALAILLTPAAAQAQQASGAAPQTTAQAASAEADSVQETQDTTVVAPIDTTTALPLAILPADIPRQAEETMVELRQMRNRLQPEQELATRTREVQDLLFLLGRRRAEFERLDLDEVSSRALEDRRQEWLAFQLQLGNWQSRLVTQAEAIVAERQRLREIRERWSETKQSAERFEMPPALVQRTESVLLAQETLLSQVRFERDVVLTVQDQVSEEILAVSSVVQEIDEARERRIGGLLTADGPPLWAAVRTQRDSIPLAAQVQNSLRDDLNQLKLYFDRTEATYGRSGQWLQIAIFISLSLLFSWFRYLSRSWTYDDPNLSASAKILARPFSAALLITLLGSRQIYPTAPLALFDASRLLILIPVLRLIPEAALAKFRSAVYVTVGLFVLDWIRNLTLSGSVFGRMALLVWGMVALLAFIWLGRPNGALARLGPGFWPKAALTLGRVAALVILAAVVANLFGFEQLAVYLSNATLAAAYSAIVLYAGYLVLGGAWRAILRTQLARSLKAIRVHIETAERRGLGLLSFIALIIWVLVVSSFLGVAGTLVSAVESALTSGFELGSVTVSLGGVIAFIFTLWLAVIISGIMRALLAEDVFPRTQHARAADSISTVVYWALLLIGFLFAAAAAGFEIGRLTLLAGAFGVGIGFGLQDVVNNFVSGLILAFERPIQVGDIVDIGTIQGTVSRIGMRSSVVRTFEGAEVVVPNSNLISNPMINWTRSDRLRRVQIPVGVAYGTDQRDVFNVLMDVSKHNEDILDHPEPSVLLRGFGDSSLNFELRFWTYRFDGFARVQSEVTRDVLDALIKAGITIPFPQRDLHLRSVDGSAGESVDEIELPTFSDPGERSPSG